MLPRKNLVPLRKEFGRITVSARVYDSLSFRLLVSFQPSSNSNSSQKPIAAFIVSKKIDKRSVVRHDIKRKLADAISSKLPRLAKNTEMVFLAKKKASEITREELAAEIEAVLKRSRLI